MTLSNHPSQGELLDFAGGLVAEARRVAIEAHLRECEACAAAVEAAHATDRLLGSWQVELDQPLVDLWPKVAAATTEQADAPNAQPTLSFLRWWQSPVVRLAASIVVAAVVGHVAGRGINLYQQASPLAAAPSPEAAMTDEPPVLLVEIFDTGSPAGLADLLLGEGPTESPTSAQEDAS